MPAGLVGKVALLDTNAKIDFREQNASVKSAGAFAAQWIHRKDFLNLKVEEDEAMASALPFIFLEYLLRDPVLTVTCAACHFDQEEKKILLNRLMINLFAGGALKFLILEQVFYRTKKSQLKQPVYIYNILKQRCFLECVLRIYCFFASLLLCLLSRIFCFFF